MMRLGGFTETQPARHHAARNRKFDVIIETSLGRLRGSADNGVAVFKGIPYGASTAGANRFLPPQPAAAWPGIRDAAAPGAAAPQEAVAPDPFSNWYNAIEPVSEDCLTLNVFTPDPDPFEPRPVMVWLHGGGWRVYSGTAPGFDGTNLAKQGDVVVVSVNHRLNLFGYLKLDDEDERFADSGNAGVLDLIQALCWVRDNVAAFGGDPGNVTIFGQSGGGAKVSALMAAAPAKGLFHRAIAQSCSGSLRLAEPAEAAVMASHLARHLGLPCATGAALQAMPMERLVACLAAVPGSYYRPVLDGRCFTRHPFDPDAPAMSNEIPFMSGNAATETRLTLASDRQNFSLSTDEVQRRVARFLRIGTAEARRIMDAYRTSDPQASASDLLGAITTDHAYIRNTRREAALQALTSRAPVYSYLFNWRTPVFDGLLRSPHEIEVPFVFGTAATATSMVGTGPDLASLTQMMIATWSSFARTGNPNNPSIPYWRQYDTDERFTMVLDIDSHAEPDPGALARAALDDLPFFEYSMPQNYARR